MSRRVHWDLRARADLQALRRIDPGTAGRVGTAVARFAADGQGDVKKLRGGSREFRLRVGDWRVLFTIDADDGTVLVARVLNRRDAYRD